ncbi:MAG: DUF4276 family protein [Terriglobia bacterium]
MVTHIEILVEEPSMEAALRVIVPKVVDHLSFEVYPYQCKLDLLDKLPARLQGYAAWLPADYRIVVIVDRDRDHCDRLKQRLEEAAHSAGLTTRTQAGGPNYKVVNRLAIEELEAWYFGDWQEVQSAFPGVSANIPRKQAYRDPDAISGGTWESFERVLQRAGYSGKNKPQSLSRRSPGRHPQG